MRRRVLIGVGAALLVVAPCCDYEQCGTETVEFTLPQPGDGVAVMIQVCLADTKDGGFEVFGTLSATGTPIGPVAVEADGVRLWASSSGVWNLSSVTDVARRGDCEPGQRVTLRRLDADPAVSFAGALTVESSTPPRGSCSVTVTVEPL